ncbi:transposase [Streptomyces sp. NPDC017448]|uniref:transposase n=1 Tax=Streptomyces sp. NPDC017448 TaxID=3364996 RepID=UPI0037956287
MGAHLPRNSFRYAARQDRGKVAELLKPVCTAPTEEAVLERLAEFAEAWGRKYPALVPLRENTWFATTFHGPAPDSPSVTLTTLDAPPS